MSKPMGPYTPIVRSGDWLVVSGQLGMVDGKLVNGGATAELRQAIANLEALLQSEGASLSDVVKTTVFLRHLGTDYDAVNEAYVECFGDHRPARSCIGVAELPRGGLVEVEAWARPGAG
jgi:2-iminobutanoate/2-iminopropanoate deaminase